MSFWGIFGCLSGGFPDVFPLILDVDLSFLFIVGELSYKV
jgi:hypothetical protein